MPSYEHEKIMNLVRKLYPELWPTLTDRDIDVHTLYCAEILSSEPKGGTKTKRLTQMVKRFRRTFGNENQKNHE